MDPFVIILKFPLKCYLLKQIFTVGTVLRISWWWTYRSKSKISHIIFLLVCKLSGSRLYETVKENVGFAKDFISSASTWILLSKNKKRKEKGIFSGYTFVKVKSFNWNKFNFVWISLHTRTYELIFKMISYGSLVTYQSEMEKNSMQNYHKENFLQPAKLAALNCLKSVTMGFINAQCFNFDRPKMVIDTQRASHSQTGSPITVFACWW